MISIGLLWSRDESKTEERRKNRKGLPGHCPAWGSKSELCPKTVLSCLLSHDLPFPIHCYSSSPANIPIIEPGLHLQMWGVEQEGKRGSTHCAALADLRLWILPACLTSTRIRGTPHHSWWPSWLVHFGLNSLWCISAHFPLSPCLS